MLAMSSNLASPGISEAYRSIARYLRWSLLGIKGNIPLLDKAFTNAQREVNVTEQAVNAVNAVNASAVRPSPMGTASAADTTTPSARRRARTLLQFTPSLPPASPMPTTPLPPPFLAASAPSPIIIAPPPLAAGPPPPAPSDGRDVLLTWLQQVGAVQPSTDNGSTASAGYVLAGATAASSSTGVIVIGPDGLPVVDGGSSLGPRPPGAGPPPPPGIGDEGTSGGGQEGANGVLVVDVQDLLYTLAVAVLLMAALIVVHGLVYLAYVWLVDKEVHPMLRFPRAEMTLAGGWTRDVRCGRVAQAASGRARTHAPCAQPRIPSRPHCHLGTCLPCTMPLSTCACTAILSCSVPHSVQPHLPPPPHRPPGLLLVALTFYASMALGSAAQEWRSSRLPALLVLALLVLPYAAFCWWITVCRWYLEEMVGWEVGWLGLEGHDARVRRLRTFSCAAACDLRPCQHRTDFETALTQTKTIKSQPALRKCQPGFPPCCP